MNASSTIEAPLNRRAPSVKDKEHRLLVLTQHALNTETLVTVRLSGTPTLAGMQSSPEESDMAYADAAESAKFCAEETVTLQNVMEVTGQRPGSITPYEMLPYANLSDHECTPSSRSDSIIQFPDAGIDRATVHVRTNSIASYVSNESAHIDWEELDKNEEKTQRNETSENSTAFLLARLEQENNALANDPKAGNLKARARSRSRPPSIQQLRKLVNAPIKPSLRYSMLPSPPPMTELEFWSALVSNYAQTAQRLPTLTSNKIRNGVPAPLRGVVWISIAGARDAFLEDEYDRLCRESSPYEKLIGKDVGRSFPGVDMFRDPNGEGQKMLGKVLNAFSLWDQEIGYCQGLGFVVGPLLMHMGDKEAFCTLVRLMEHYDLRSCFLPNLSGLHLRIYQFQQLLSQHLPQLTKHLDSMNLEPVYLSQWFLSFFGVTCPLPMLLRIYDVILAEGASETLMRVALSLMRRNEKKILATSEFEDVMQLLLSRGLWDTYGCNADDLVHDFCGLTGLVTRESLQRLETSFKGSQSEDLLPHASSRPDIHSAASRFLGRFWAGSTPLTKTNSSSPSLSAPSRPTSYLCRTPSKQSMASTSNSIDSSDSTPSATSTDITKMSRQASADWAQRKKSTGNSASARATRVPTNVDKDLHCQIEDLLTALNDMQKYQNSLSSELQREREERDEDRVVVQRVIDQLKLKGSLAAVSEDTAGLLVGDISVKPDGLCLSSSTGECLNELAGRFLSTSLRRSSISQTKYQLREDVTRWKAQYAEEAARSTELSQRLNEGERNASQLKEQLREVRSRLQESHRDKQRLDKTIQDFRSRRSSAYEATVEPHSATSIISLNGLRDFKLGRSSPSSSAQASPTFSKRTSSLNAQALLATEDTRPVTDEALLLGLVNAKTAEAVARQELEEVKGRLDSLKRLLGTNSASSGHQRQSPSSHGLCFGSAIKGAQDPPKLIVPNLPNTGGFFSGWGKRSASASAATSGEPQ